MPVRKTQSLFQEIILYFMKGIVKLFVVLIIGSSLTSCFEVVDEISLREDGSGEFLLTVNMSRSKTKIESMMLLENVKGYKVPSKAEVEKFIDDLVIMLKESKGISNVKKTIDFNEFIFTIGFHFNSVEDINNAVERLTVRNTKNVRNPESLNLRYAYNTTTREFSRYYEPHDKDKAEYEKLDEEDKKMFNEAIYVSISRFDLQVQACTNKNAKISKSGNAVMIRSSATNIFRGTTSISNTVQLK